MTTKLRSTAIALAVSLAAVPVVAAPADAAAKTKAKPAATKTAKKRTAAKRKATKAKTAARPAVVESVSTTSTPAPAPAPADAPAPTSTSVVSIGGFVFYNVSYADAVAQYEALIASGVTPPPPVTSISVTTTVGN